jgi:hypothetical protein
MDRPFLLLTIPFVACSIANLANAGQTTNHAGALACVTDKWEEKEVEKGIS